MTAVSLRPDLLEALDQTARQEDVDVDELINAAVSQYLAQIRQRKIQAESRAFDAMKADLLLKYPGEYVAVHNGQVIDHDPDLRTLHLRVYEKYGRTPVLLKQVLAGPERELVIRSPRLER
jgi:hypothetical protein